MEKENLQSKAQCAIHPFGSLKNYKYVVICSYYGKKILLSRHKTHNTWEAQGGQIEENEPPFNAAKRELFKKSGVTDAQLLPVCDYQANDASGIVYLAMVHKLGDLPASEMQEIALFNRLPKELTHPQITPQLFEAAYQVKSITEMEESLNQLSTAILDLKEAFEEVKSMQGEANSLFDYYGSKTWFSHRDAYDLGEIAKDVPCGVLTEDAVYDLQGDYEQLLREIREFADTQLPPAGF